MDMDKGQVHAVGPLYYQFASFSFHINQTNDSRDAAIFEIWPWNIYGQGCGEGQMSRSHNIPSIQPMHFFLFHINRTNHFWDNSKLVFDLGKTHPKLFKENLQKIRLFNIISTTFNQLIIMTRAIKLQGFIVTLVQGDGKVIQYISRYLYIICPKHLRFSSSCFDVRGKRCCGGWRGGGQGGNVMKTLSHPTQGWLIDSSWVIIIR